MSDAKEYRFGKLSLDPGDVLVFKFTGVLSREASQNFMSSVKRVMGEDTKVLILDDKADVAVLSREAA